jgi:arabinogalactan oligomer/maltooligosaccharide transport system permease protein
VARARLAFAAALALIALLASAAARAETVVLWHAYRGAEEKALASVVAGIERSSPGLEIRALAVPYDALVTKLDASLPRTIGPDLFIYAHERIGDWAERGFLTPVELDAESERDLLPAALAALRHDGKLYGLPLAFKCVALFYRTDRIREPPATTDELLRLAAEQVAAGRVGLAYEAESFYLQAAWLHGFGGRLFTDDGSLAIESAGSARSLAFAADLVNRRLVPQESSGALVTQMFASGQASMAVSGPWLLGELPAALPYAVAPLPRVSATGKPAEPLLSVEAVAVSRQARSPQAAMRVARALVGFDSALARATQGRQPVATLSAYRDARVARDRVLTAFAEQAKHAVPIPATASMRLLWDPARRALREVLRGDRTPEQALRGCARRFALDARPEPPSRSPLAALALLGALGCAAAVALVRWLRRGEVRAGLWSSRFALLACTPAALAVVTLLGLPMLAGTAASLFATSGGGARYVGLANFADILTGGGDELARWGSFYVVLLVTVAWTAVNVALHLGIGVALALVLHRPTLRLRGVYRVLFIVPWAIPNYITALVWKGMFHRQLGAINALLGLLGVEPVSWFSSFSTAFAANVATNTWLGFPFMMVVTLGALASVPRDLLEAAAVDGATRWQRFRHVTLPLLLPALGPAALLGSVWTFNMFNVVYLVSGGEPNGATEILVSEVYRWAFTRQARYGYACAYAVLIFLVLLGYAALTQRRLAEAKT